MNLPPPGIIWNSLPLPALMLDVNDRVIEINPAAELFLNLSARALKGQALGERLAISAPLEEIFARVRKNRSALFVNDVDLTTGERAPVQCNLQAAPIADDPETVLLLISPREIADRLGRASMVKSAARSAIGMAEMLAHEIKNPLAGIAGAAQLLSMGLSGEDLGLTDLIVDETRRIVKLLEQVEQFVHARGDALGRPAEQARHGRDVARDAPVRKQPVPLDRIADAAAKLLGCDRRRIDAVDADRAAGRRDQPVDHAQQRRLAAARCADERGDRAALHRQRYVVDGDHVAEAFADSFDLDHPARPFASDVAASNTTAAASASAIVGIAPSSTRSAAD